MTKTPPNPAKARLLGQIAGRAAEVNTKRQAYAAELADRDREVFRAWKAGALYSELMSATGLSRIAVYKMLERANGGPLSQ